MTTQFMLLPAALALALFGLFAKWPPETVHAATSTPGEHAPERRWFAAHGLHPVAIRQLANEGGFVATLYADPACAGQLAVMPVARNAEGAALLGEALPGSRTRFVHDGRLYHDYPALRVGLQRLADAVSRGPQRVPPVLAIAERGSCALAARLSWSELPQVSAERSR